MTLQEKVKIPYSLKQENRKNINLMSKSSYQIYHLTSSITGGAGIATNRIHLLLRSDGYSSFLIRGDEIPPKPIQKLILNFKNAIKYLLPKRILNFRKYLKYNNYQAAYCFYQSKEDVKDGLNKSLFKNISEIDILFVYWISDFLNIYDIEFLKSKYDCRIIFVMVDQVHVSGGYHFLLKEYNQYLKKKGNKIEKPNKKKYSKQFKIKKEIISKISAEIIAFSNNDIETARECGFNFKKYWKTVIPIESEYLKPTEKASNDNSNVRTIFCCAYNLNDYRKGSDLFIKTLNSLDLMLDAKQKIKVLCSKDTNPNIFKFNKISSVYFDYNEDPKIYSKNYHDSDLFLFTSIADSAPQMLSEALFCGVPVISFDIANVSEIITEENDGSIISNFDPDQMADKAYNFLFKKKNINSANNKMRRYNKIKEYHRSDKVLRSFEQIIIKG